MRTFLLFAALVFSFTATAQTVFEPLTLREARDIAKEEGTFVFAYFFNKKPSMPQRGWLRDSVQALQSKFVNTWIDVTYSKIDTYEYGVKSGPTLIIMDADGKEYFRSRGYVGLFELMDVLTQFPEDMQHVYAADSIAQAQPDNFGAQLNRAQAYQEAARNAKRPVSGQLVKVSDKALKDAARILARTKGAPAYVKEYLKLMEAENLLLRRRATKAIGVVNVLEKKLHASNAALAYYIKGVAYRKIDLPGLAEDYYNKLQLAKDNEELLARYQKQQE